MRIIDGVRYRDEDAKEYGLTGGREAQVGDRELDRTAYAPAHVRKAQQKAAKGQTILTTGADEDEKTADDVQPDEAPVEPVSKDEVDNGKPAGRRAR